MSEDMAANPLRGEIDLVAGDTTYTLRPTTNALVALEKATGLAYGDLLNRLPAMDMVHLRAMIFHLLQPVHGKTVKTLEQAGDLIDAAGGHHGVFPVIVAMLALNRPKKDDTKAGGGDGNPPDAQAGTGGASSSTPGEPV